MDTWKINISGQIGWHCVLAMLGRPYVQLWSPYAETSGNKDYVKENQQIIDVIRDRLKIAQSQQKSYADQKRRTWEPKVGHMV
jgi:hypothetical protein